MGRILIVVDEPELRRSLASNLRQGRHEVFEAVSVEEARRSLLASGYDAVFADERMPDGEGLQVLKAAREIDASISVVLLTGAASIELAVESMRQGAFDFLTKPFEPEVLCATARRACEHATLLRENLVLKDAVARLEAASEFYGENPVLRAVCGQVHSTPMEKLPQPFDLSEFLDQTEKELIVRTLASTGGAQAEAARRLGLSRSALAYKLTKYGIRGNHGGWQQPN